ncbi:MAG: hypothetical protein OQK58_12970, partial [Gammaproteobacteria bacterium]|nr:hypothetical protein [Gammaproteobacteria bacterium]
MNKSDYLTMKDLTIETVYDEMVAKGVTEYDAATAVGLWILENLGKTKRVFNYKQTFSEHEPVCTSSFIRTFTHSDWIDGESVVQAEQSTAEDGFNFRFHSIEDDFDTVKLELLKAFDCMDDMREHVYKRFEEVKTELNRINNDIYNCCNKDNGSTKWPQIQYGALTQSGVKYMGASKINDSYVSVWETAQGMMMLPSAYTIGVDVLKDERVQTPGAMAEFIEDTEGVKEHFGN